MNCECCQKTLDTAEILAAEEPKTVCLATFQVAPGNGTVWGLRGLNIRIGDTPNVVTAGGDLVVTNGTDKIQTVLVTLGRKSITLEVAGGLV